MSARPYDRFLAERFMRWAAPLVQPGYRYQFKSPDPENAQSLYEALVELADSQTVVADGVELPSIACGAVRLLPVLHGPGFTENYISRLRDEVAGGGGAFRDTALLIIHNSMLDTLINSAQDLAVAGAIWDPRRFKAELYGLIKGDGPEEVLSKCLLEDQLSFILDQGATVFGFAPIYSRLTDGKLEFWELGLFNDPLLLDYSDDPRAIRRRLDENRQLRSDIEDVVENYGEQLEDKLKEFSPQFVQKHFIDKRDWMSLELEDFRAEKSKNAAPGLVFLGIDAAGCTIHQRAKSQTKAGQRNRSVIVEAPAGATEIALRLEFQATDLEPRHFSLKHNPGLKADAACKVTKFRMADFAFPFDGKPTYVTIDLPRANRSECYQFHCLFVEAGRFHFGPIENHFRVEPKDQRITISWEEDQLQVHPTRPEVQVLEEGALVVDVQAVGVVNFEALASQTDEIAFELRSDGHCVALNVEGPATEERLSLPLLFDAERFPRLFRDDYNGEYNRAKKKIVLDGTETAAVGVRITLLDLEARFLDDRLVALAPGADVPLAAIKDSFPALHDAYEAWYEVLEELHTLPSLAGWGDAFRLRVRAVLDAYEAALDAIELDAVLNADQKRLLAIGIVSHGSQKRFSPFHPLVLAYHLELAERILDDRAEDGSSSFTTLPEVTVKRLTASGLLPFVFDPESDYAHVQPMREDTFWLELIPQRDASYAFVRRLVRDKLEEFTKAYARLFAAGPRSSLIVNAINQGGADELFLGLVAYYERKGDAGVGIHVNFYDDALGFNAFDRFSELASSDALKMWFAEAQHPVRGELDTLIDLMRSRVTYSKFKTPVDDAPLAYAHLAFFRNNARVQRRDTRIEQNASGILCDGLIAGEAAATKDSSYFTAFGLRGVDYEASQALRIARLVGMLLQPALQNDTPYVGMGLSLAVSTEFKDLLARSYASSLWTTIIDPKVTLDFFTSQKDVVLIHYSDQYTSSASYDAITVTRHVKIFQHLVGQASLLVEFNAFNGTWEPVPRMVCRRPPVAVESAPRNFSSRSAAA